jgi:hypothetical protein
MGEKRFRAPPQGRARWETLSSRLALIEQPVVGLEPDRSFPRVRLKQNWSFQESDAVRRPRMRVEDP